MKKLLFPVIALTLILLMAGVVGAQAEQALVTVRVTTGEGEPQSGVTVAKKYSATGPTSWFPGGATDENGEISAYFDVGTTLYLQARANVSRSEWQSQTVEAGGNLYEFSTTTVYVESGYRVSFGGATGQYQWLKDTTRHVFPGTYVFHFNGLGRINLPVSGSVMNLVENGIEYEWRPPVYDGMVIINKNVTYPFKFQVVIAGYPIIMDKYYDKELVSLEIAGILMDDLECDEEKAEFKAHFKVRDYPELGNFDYMAEAFYDDISQSTLDFSIDLKK